MISKQRAIQLRKLIESASSSLTDEVALTGIELFPSWAAGQTYAVDERVRYDGVLYKCVQAHTSQSDWIPSTVPALWTVVSLDEWPEWVQPTGAQDAYNKGDKVTYNGVHYVSLIDGNVWSPENYPAGWEART